MTKRATYSVGEIVERYGISRSTVNRLIREGLIPSSKLLGRRLINAKGFERVVRQGVKPRERDRRKMDAKMDVHGDR